MNFVQPSYSCAVCGKGANVWCHQDAASLCYDCDEREHTANALAINHTRTALPQQSHAMKCTSPIRSHARECHAAPAQDLLARAQAEYTVNHGATPGHPSFAQVCDVPDVFAVDDRLDASFLAGPSFDSLELFQDFLEAEPLIFGDDDDHASHKPLHPGRVNVEEAWDSSWQDSSWQDSPFVPLAEYAAVPNVSAPCAAAPPTTEPTASGAEGTPPAAVSDQPASQSQATGELHSEATALLPREPLAHPSMAPPVSTCSAAATGAQAMMASWGQQGAYMMPYMPPMGPPGMVFMQQLPPWVSYVPASLRPTAVEDKEVAAECAQARSIKIARFRQKKQRLSVRKAVRYENRKRYADARPRVNGRFISKVEGAAAARAAAV